MLNLDKRYLVVGILFIGLSFFIGLKYAEHQNNFKIQETTDLVAISGDTENNSTVQESFNTIQVYVTGEVVNPGVYVLNEDARVHEAVDMAGGLSSEAQDKNLNMAAKLRDGETLYVPSINETGPSVAPSVSAAANSRVNINTASAAELEQKLDGIGPSLAQRIVEYRDNQGFFKKVEDLKKVSGIGDKKFEAIKEQIDV
ncbi:MAG: ComEA family DNA-binding protein [Syntrophomonadaceae bacterium]|jgi:competence protein ComEA|nr:ComEA family DNA-binding protein [Syntrophomonadaceae bacterium]